MFHSFILKNHLRKTEMPLCMIARTSAEAAQIIFDHTLSGIDWKGRELVHVPDERIARELTDALNGVPHEFN